MMLHAPFSVRSPMTSVLTQVNIERLSPCPCSMTLIVLGLASFCGWFISMLSGGGGPLILLPLVSFLFGTQALAPIVTVGMLVGNGQRAVYLWQNIDWQVTLWYTPGAIAGAILGSYAVTQINLEWLQIVVGLVLVWMAVSYGWGLWREQIQGEEQIQERIQTAPIFQIQTWHFLPLSFLNAFGSGLIGSTGPILNPVYLNYGLVKEQMVATRSLNVLIAHIIKIIAYLAFGVLSGPYVLYGLVIGLAAIPSNHWGKQLLTRMSSEQFQQIVLAFVGGQRHLHDLGSATAPSHCLPHPLRNFLNPNSHPISSP